MGLSDTHILHIGRISARGVVVLTKCLVVASRVALHDQLLLLASLEESIVVPITAQLLNLLMSSLVVADLWIALIRLLEHWDYFTAVRDAIAIVLDLV